MIWIYKRFIVHSLKVVVFVVFFFWVIEVALNFFQQYDKEQAELARSNFAILRKEAQPILDLVGSWQSLLLLCHTCLYFCWSNSECWFHLVGMC